MKKTQFIIIVLIFDLILMISYFIYSRRSLTHDDLGFRNVKTTRDTIYQSIATSEHQQYIEIFLDREYMRLLRLKSLHEGDREAFGEWMEIYSHCGFQHDFEGNIFLFADKTKSLDYLMLYISSLAVGLENAKMNSSKKYLSLYYLKKLQELKVMFHNLGIQLIVCNPFQCYDIGL
jgi:hypothetical protein